jgi:hypothetical protein
MMLLIIGRQIPRLNDFEPYISGHKSDSSRLGLDAEG